MALNFSTTSQTTLSQGIKMLVWGDSGMGKTSLCATAPKPIILSAERGLLSLGKKNLERLHGVDNPAIAYEIPVIQINNIQDLIDAYNFMLSNPHAKAFRTVLLDSISEIGETVLNNAKRTVKDPRQAYGAMIEQMETVIRQFRDLEGINVVMLAKAEYAKDEVTGISKYGPSMPGSKLGQKLPYFFDEVLKLGVNKDAKGNPFRFLQSQPDLQNIAKDRSGALDQIEPPNLTHVFNKILQGV